MQTKPHFDGKRFFNPDAPQARGLLDVLHWKLTTRPNPSPKWIDDVHPAKPPARVDSLEIRITMVNHSTVLLQLCGINILTDPIWSLRASPVSWAGPKRRRQPGIRLTDLPPIDAVLLSHNHYDHCDLPTLRELAKNSQCRFIVPLGLAKLMRTEAIAQVADELDWCDTVSLGPLRCHAVPAMHFSARSTGDRNRTLWCGYWIESPQGAIYFAGDTAFGGHFHEMRQSFGPPRLALLPIGAYEPRWFMSAVHMSPEEALNAATILGASVNIAIHHGTFQLADESLDAPATELRRLKADSVIRLLANGEAVAIPRQ